MSDTTRAPGEMPTPALNKKLVDCTSLGEAFNSKEFRERLGAVPKHIPPEHMLHAFINAAGRTPNMNKCDVRQALGMFMVLAHLGLPPNTVENKAHLIPFKYTNRYNPVTKKKEDGYDLQLIIGYPGYVDLCYRSGFIRDMQTGLYLPGDEWREVNGTRKELYHSRNLDIDNSDATPKAAYAVATTTTEGVIYEVMSWLEIQKIKRRSQAFRRAERAFNDAKDKGWAVPATWTEAPWVAHEREMARKTALRRLVKILPHCPELRAGAEIEDRQEERDKPLDFSGVIDSTDYHYTDPIPEAEVEPTDPGAAHTDRRQEPQQERQAQQAERPARQPRAARVAPKPKPPEFSTSLVDAYGEVVGEFTTPQDFGREFLAQMEDATEEDREQLLGNNERAIDVIEQKYPEVYTRYVAPFLQQPEQQQEPERAERAEPPQADPPPADEDGEVEETHPLEFEAVRPVTQRGRAMWRPWVHAVEDDASTVSEPTDLRQWTQAQREVLSEAPAAERAAAIKVVLEAHRRLKVEPPDWLAALLVDKPERTPAQKDEKWAADRFTDLEALPEDHEGKSLFTNLVNSVRVTMDRLKRENPDLHRRVAAAFEDKHKRFPK